MIANRGLGILEAVVITCALLYLILDVRTDLQALKVRVATFERTRRTNLAYCLAHNMNIIVINAIVSFFAALVLHELGHYFAARMCAVPIKQAGFGWGPKLYGVRCSEVDCQLRLLPVGAYVQMDMIALQRRPLVQQLFVLGAGIGVNLVLCVANLGITLWRIQSRTRNWEFDSAVSARRMEERDGDRSASCLDDRVRWSSGS